MQLAKDCGRGIVSRHLLPRWIAAHSLARVVVMHWSALLGTVVTVVAVLMVVAATAWSVRIIDRISRDNLNSLREIKRELRHGGRRN
jgi:hypothetical protein